MFDAYSAIFQKWWHLFIGGIVGFAIGYFLCLFLTGRQKQEVINVNVNEDGQNRNPTEVK